MPGICLQSGRHPGICLAFNWAANGLFFPFLVIGHMPGICLDGANTPVSPVVRISPSRHMPGIYCVCKWPIFPILGDWAYAGHMPEWCQIPPFHPLSAFRHIWGISWAYASRHMRRICLAYASYFEHIPHICPIYASFSIFWCHKKCPAYAGSLAMECFSIAKIPAYAGHFSLHRQTPGICPAYA